MLAFRLGILLTLGLLGATACAPPQERASAYLEKAQVLYDAGDYVKARLEAQNAAQIDPKNAEARYLLALIAEQEGDVREMLGHLLFVVEANPDNMDARLKLGTLYFLGQAYDEAAAQSEALLDIAPGDANVRLLYARVLVQRGDREAAYREIARALTIEPDNVDGITLQAAAYAIDDPDKALGYLDESIARLDAEQGQRLRELRILLLGQQQRLQEVEEEFQALVRDFPDEQAYQFQLARFYSSQGRMDEAEAVLRRIAELNPEDSTLRLGLVQFLATQRDLDAAEEALKAFIEQTPDDTRLGLALGELYEQSDRPDQASAAYAAVAKRKPRSEDAYKARARMAALDVKAGRVDAARDAVNAVLKETPDQPDALLLRAALSFADQQFDTALADLRLVLRKDPESERALFLLAQTYARTDELVLAKDAYRRLLAVNPRYPGARIQLAALHAASNELEEAEALLRDQVADNPEDLLATGRLVEVLMRRGDTADAETEAERMAAREDQAGIGDFELGRVRFLRQDYAGAAEAFQRAVEQRPGDPLPLEGLAQSWAAAEKTDTAIRYLTAHLEHYPDQLHAKLLLGSMYGRVGDTANAERYLEEVIAARPEVPVTYLTLAAVNRNSREGRIAAYRRGLEAVPGDEQLSMLLGTEYERAGDFDAALAVYGALVEAKPDYLPGVNNLAALLLDHRADEASHERALELAERLADNESPALVDTLGWAYYRNGDFLRAVAELERVVGKAGQVPIFRYHLGMAYYRAGNNVAARQQLAEAAKPDTAPYPGLDEARATLELLKELG